MVQASHSSRRKVIGMEIIIRKLQTKDIKAVSDIEAASFTMPWSAQDFADLVYARHSLYLVAEVDGQVVGCCGFIQMSHEAAISNVVVAEHMRGNGIGQAMLEELIKQGQAMDIEDFTLEVRVSNEPAIHIYKKLNFLSEGIRPDFYDEPKEDAMIMWRRNFV